jgi:hypothetical protein
LFLVARNGTRQSESRRPWWLGILHSFVCVGGYVTALLVSCDGDFPALSRNISVEVLVSSFRWRASRLKTMLRVLYQRACECCLLASVILGSWDPRTVILSFSSAVLTASYATSDAAFSPRLGVRTVIVMVERDGMALVQVQVQDVVHDAIQLARESILQSFPRSIVAARTSCSDIARLDLQVRRAEYRL